MSHSFVSGGTTPQWGSQHAVAQSITSGTELAAESEADSRGYDQSTYMTAYPPHGSAVRCHGSVVVLSGYPSHGSYHVRSLVREAEPSRQHAMMMKLPSRTMKGWSVAWLRPGTSFLLPEGQICQRREEVRGVGVSTATVNVKTRWNRGCGMALPAPKTSKVRMQGMYDKQNR
jgi:hypothetical protein